MLTLYFYIRVSHWITFMTCGEETAKAPVAAPDRSVTLESKEGFEGESFSDSSC